MPTTRPRYQVTETPDIAHALDVAAGRWPDEPRFKLLARLVLAGGSSLEQEHDDAISRRRNAVRATNGEYGHVFERDYLAQLRADWPE